MPEAHGVADLVNQAAKRFFTPLRHIDDLAIGSVDVANEGIARAGVAYEAKTGTRFGLGNFGKSDAGVISPVLYGRLDCCPVH